MKKAYPAIDIFRIIAAVLVITVHTAPAELFGDTAHLLLSGVTARLAVPFFFVTSAFFLFSKGISDSRRIRGFLRKTLIIYAVSILLYLPINIYNGYFSKGNIISKIIKDLLFDGTMYHLWYLPAAAFGALIAWLLIRRFGGKKAVIITALLYTVGVFGNSWFGLVSGIPLVGGFYDGIFAFSDYTRNGIFFAPLFFVIGYMFARNRIKIKTSLSAVGFVASFALMLGEGIFADKLGYIYNGNNSMYFMLPVCLVFLFSLLSKKRGKRLADLGTVSLCVYIIHPLVIAALHFAERFAVLEKYLQNNMICFVLTTVISFVAALLFTLIYNRLKPKKPDIPTDTDRSWIEFDTAAFDNNVKALTDIMPDGCEMMGVVKAEGYGHGAWATASRLNDLGVRAFAVATLDEGIELRKMDILGEILIMGYTHPSCARLLRKYRLSQTVIDLPYAKALNAKNKRVMCHIKIDTGMHRLGCDYADIDGIASVFHMKNLDIRGIFTHLCVCDTLEKNDIEFTALQEKRFSETLDALKQRGIKLPKIHIQSSYGLLNRNELSCAYARLGIILYGVKSATADKTVLMPDVKPVLSIKTRVALVREIEKGDSAGYGRAFTATEKTRLAVLPIGYADGIPRSASCGNGYALIRGVRCPIAGRVCMDQLDVDVTAVEGVCAGDIATLVGTDGAETIPVTELADNADTLSNEILSRLGRRLKIREI